MDRMLITEFYDVMNCLKYADRAIWESSRLQCFFTAQKNCRKQLKLHDIFPLPWDTNKASISKQDIAELKQQQTQMEALINAHANTQQKDTL